MRTRSCSGTIGLNLNRVQLHKGAPLRRRPGDPETLKLVRAAFAPGQLRARGLSPLAAAAEPTPEPALRFVSPSAQGSGGARPPARPGKRESSPGAPGRGGGGRKSLRAGAGAARGVGSEELGVCGARGEGGRGPGPALERSAARAVSPASPPAGPEPAPGAPPGDPTFACVRGAGGGGGGGGGARSGRGSLPRM